MGPSPAWPITAAHGQVHCAREQVKSRVQIGECQCQECALRLKGKQGILQERNDVEFALKPTPPLALFSFSILPLPSPAPCPLLPLGPEELGIQPKSPRRGLHSREVMALPHFILGSRCSVLNTNCSDQFPGTLVESEFPPNPQDFSQIQKGLQLSCY